MEHLSTNISAIPFATTVDYGDDPRWLRRAHSLIQPIPDRPSLRHELSVLFRLLQAATREKALILQSSTRLHGELLASMWVSLWPKKRRPVIVMMGCMWQRDPGLRGFIEQIIVRLADRAINRYAVQSTDEMTLFPATWGISAAKTRYCPFFYTITQQDMAIEPPPPGDYIFAGGNSHRNYEPLIEAARQMPEYRFVIATNRLKPDDHLPPNVTARSVPHQEYIGLLRSSAAVVVALQQGLNRSVGQQTYLNAMWLGKPTIVADTTGVRDYIRDGETALIVDGSPEDYVRKLRWVLDPANRAEVARITQKGQQVAREQFTYENHIARLLAILDEALQEVILDEKRAEEG
jgi:glycosyltransferase involved in cell wall biosynthesis